MEKDAASPNRSARVVDSVGLRFYLATLARPVLRRLPRGANICYGSLAGQALTSLAGDNLLRERLSNPMRVFFDRRINAFILADLCDCVSRSHYFTGHYFEQLVPLLVRRILPRGGVFLDVGANRGIHTLFAAKFLGTSGRVFAFEPNPSAFRVLAAHMTMNGIRNCEIHNIGLSDTEGTLSLATPAQSVLASFRDAPGENHVEVPVRTIESIAAPDWVNGPVLVKVDVEGYEHKVIRGMGNLLDHPDMAVVCEVTDQWLRETGTSAAALFHEMQQKGFRAYHCTVGYSMLMTPVLKLTQLHAPMTGPFQYDVLFAREALLT